MKADQLKVAERVTCGDCGAAVVGARSLVTKLRPAANLAEAKVLPVALAPDEQEGNVLLQQIDGELRAIVFGADPLLTYLREHGVQLRRLHLVCKTEDPKPTEGNAA